MAEAAINILVTGGSGQLGLALARQAWPDGVRLHRPGRETLDLTDPASVAAAFARTPFAAVINAAAHTAVDAAETEVGASFAVNAGGPAALADAARAAGIPVVHVSTDHVFDGAGGAPYGEDAVPSPVNVYGAGKRAGELAVLSGVSRAVIVRTAWLISAHRQNFVRAVLARAERGEPIRVVDDQIGCPTGADDLAAAMATITLRLIADPEAPTGIYHFTNAGAASRHELAQAVMAASCSQGGPTVDVTAIATADWPTAARRPADSRLSSARIGRDYGVHPRPWTQAVAAIVAELSQGDRQP